MQTNGSATMSTKRPPNVRQDAHADNAAPITAAESAWSLYLGDAYRIVRRCLHSNERLLSDAMSEIQTRDFVLSTGSARKAIRSLLGDDHKPTPLSDDQLTKSQELTARRIRLRDRIVDALGLSGTWDRMSDQAQSIKNRRKAAAILHSQRVLPEPPCAMPAKTNRRTLNEADHDTRAREADRVAQEMCP